MASGGYDLAEPFDARVVSVYRFAVDAAELDHALSALAPGQSEHLGHPHRSDRLPRWLEGRLGLLVTGSLLVDEGGVTRLVLEPLP